MKKQLLILFSIISLNSFSQISFEKGHYIMNSGEKINGLIRNNDWKDNPTEFRFKLSETEDYKTLSINDVKEFEIYGSAKYYRSVVNIDKSSDIVNELNDISTPIFEKKQLFLKVIIEGRASLFQYVDGLLTRFLYNINEGEIKPLIYKRYINISKNIARNNQYKQQLWNALKCPDILLKNVENLKYNTEQLANIFEKFNICEKSEYINFKKKEKKDMFNLSIKPGLNYSSVAISSGARAFKNADFGSQFGFRLGVEAEFIMPFNKNKWAIIVEPTYQYFKAEKKLNTTAKKVSVDFKTIEVPIGIRHYMFMKNGGKLFLNGLLLISFKPNSKFDFEHADDLEVTIETGVAFGLGYTRKKYSFEFRYALNRDVIGFAPSWSSDYSVASLILGYRLF